MKINPNRWLFLALIALTISCSDDDVETEALSVFSITMNGANFVDGMDNLPVSSSIAIVFSAAVNPAEFEKEFSISPAPASMQFSYANQSSKVTIDLALEFSTSYQMIIGTSPFGQKGERLDGAIFRTFTTMADGVIYSLPACTSATNDCLQTVTLTGNSSGDVDFYSSFPIYEEMAAWENLEAAIIVVHGANRDADNYFNFLMSTLQANSLEQKVILIAPFFKNQQEASGNDFYWTNTGWRSGNNSLGTNAISSFEVVDKLIEQLADESHFPVLKKIIVTGHSSGALFTHLYAAANKVEATNPDLVFEYVPANSQYYYYPDGQRINESNNQLYIPAGCTGYDFWPAGFNIVPPYLSATDISAFNSQFINRSITYLLGNGTGSDPALNTTDCAATLLGSSRYNRGENMFRYLELVFPGGSHKHQKTIVNGIGHDGQGMYQSPEFRALLAQLLN